MDNSDYLPQYQKSRDEKLNLYLCSKSNKYDRIQGKIYQSIH